MCGDMVLHLTMPRALANPSRPHRLEEAIYVNGATELGIADMQSNPRARTEEPLFGVRAKGPDRRRRESVNVT